MRRLVTMAHAASELTTRLLRSTSMLWRGINYTVLKWGWHACAGGLPRNYLLTPGAAIARASAGCVS